MRADTLSTVKRTPSGRGVYANLRWSCHHCGKPLERIAIELFGRQTEVPCWGSCGCEESKWDGLNIVQADRKYYKAGIPERYLDADDEVAEHLLALESGRSLYIHGPYGAGKTHLACSIAKRLLNMGVSVRFENSRHLMTEIQGMFDGRRTDALDRAANCRVLVLDDLGKEQVTAFSISMLYELLDTRYMQGKQVIVTSNFSRDKLLERWDAADHVTAESIVSRLCEKTDVVFMDGDDRRLR